MAASDVLEAWILEHFFRNNAQVSPVTLFCALHLDDPTDEDFSQTGQALPGQSGAAASIVAGAPAGQARITGLTGMVASSVGRDLELSGAASGGNNGTFEIATLVSSSSVDIINGAAVIPDANNGAVSWVERNKPTEVGAGIGYARQAITFGPVGDSGVGQAVLNDANLTFGPATADWGALTHFSIHDALTLGNMLTHGALAGGKIVLNTQSFGVGIGQIEVKQT